MFRQFAFASLAALGVMIPNTAQAQAQVVVSIPVPVLRPHHHHLYRVEYRASVWEERTFCDYGEGRRFERLKLLDGFDAQLVRVGPDWKVRYRVNVWQTYASVPSHLEAHDLGRALERRGYIARVVHD